jgi:hypothetical protein
MIQTEIWRDEDELHFAPYCESITNPDPSLSTAAQPPPSLYPFTNHPVASALHSASRSAIVPPDLLQGLETIAVDPGNHTHLTAFRGDPFPLFVEFSAATNGIIEELENLRAMREEDDEPTDEEVELEEQFTELKRSHAASFKSLFRSLSSRCTRHLTGAQRSEQIHQEFRRKDKVVSKKRNVTPLHDLITAMQGFQAGLHGQSMNECTTYLAGRASIIDEASRRYNNDRFLVKNRFSNRILMERGRSKIADYIGWRISRQELLGEAVDAGQTRRLADFRPKEQRAASDRTYKQQFIDDDNDKMQDLSPKLAGVYDRVHKLPQDPRALVLFGAGSKSHSKAYGPVGSRVSALACRDKSKLMILAHKSNAVDLAGKGHPVVLIPEKGTNRFCPLSMEALPHNGSQYPRPPAPPAGHDFAGTEVQHLEARFKECSDAGHM